MQEINLMINQVERQLEVSRRPKEKESFDKRGRNEHYFWNLGRVLLCRGGRGPSAQREERADIGEEKGRKMPGDGKNGKKRLQKMNVLVIFLAFRVQSWPGIEEDKVVLSMVYIKRVPPQPTG